MMQLEEELVEEFDNFEAGDETNENGSEIAEFEDNPEMVAEEARALARDWIIEFFAGKQMHCGGDIPLQVLLTDHNIDLLLKTNMSSATVIVYAAMEVSNGAPYAIKMGGISDDVKWILTFIKHCANQSVPNCFVGGLMLIYLELCDGVPIPRELLHV